MALHENKQSAGWQALPACPRTATAGLLTRLPTKIQGKRQRHLAKESSDGLGVPAQQRGLKPPPKPLRCLTWQALPVPVPKSLAALFAPPGSCCEHTCQRQHSWDVCAWLCLQGSVRGKGRHSTQGCEDTIGASTARKTHYSTACNTHQGYMGAIDCFQSLAGGQGEFGCVV